MCQGLGTCNEMLYMQVKIEKPIMRIPMLAIHLNRTINSDGFNPNKQTELAPILATSARLQLEGAGADTTNTKDSDNGTGNGSDSKGEENGRMMHHPALLCALADAADCKAEDIVDLELNCCDTQPGQLGGLRDEFVFVGRLDNLAMSWCSMQVWQSCDRLQASTLLCSMPGRHAQNLCSCLHLCAQLVQTCALACACVPSTERANSLTWSNWHFMQPTCSYKLVVRLQALMDSKELDNEAGVRAVALFDHEEVGSSSAVGAGGPLMRDAITRISRSLAGGEGDATERCLQRSFLVSADMAHGLHPNYADKHEPDHKPDFHKCAPSPFTPGYPMTSPTAGGFPRRCPPALA